MRERIKTELENAVQKIFFKAQADMEIKNGDISMENSMKLNKFVEECTETIMDALKAQL